MTNEAFNVEGSVPVNSNIRKPAVRDINRADEQNGSVPVGVSATTVATEFGNRVLHKTVITCTATPIVITDDAATAQYGGVQLYAFPEGMLMFMGATIDGSLTGITPIVDAFDGDIALGTAAAGTGATLTGTEADLLTSTATTQASSKVATTDAQSVATALTESGARWLDGTATAKKLFLNYVIDDEDAHTGSMSATFTGVVSFCWLVLGDN